MKKMSSAMKSKRAAKAGGIMALCLTAMGGVGSAAAASGTINTATGVDASGCVQNGFHYVSGNNDIAPGPHCWSTTDNSTVAPIAQVDNSKTEADLEKVENTSPLSPKSYLAKDTFAYKKLTGNEQKSAYSREISTEYTDVNNAKNVWLTGSNFGGYENGKVYSGSESIPIFTVDSSNPHQHFVNISSTDGRVISSAKNKEMMLGKIPLPSWYKPSSSGDHSIAIYDVATGIYRSYYYFVPTEDGAKDSYEFASGGYVYGKPNFGGLGDNNYWMSLITGTSSVVGMTNELTQIGVDEIRSGKINHAISMTTEDYAKLVSFPAKQSDGRVTTDQQPFMPQAGQRFTLPKTLNVDEYADQNQIDPVMRMILHAVQDYGGILTDHNLFCNAFNFENPTGYAPYAREGKNVYMDDPEISSKIKNFNSETFPTDKLEWMPANYTEDTKSPAGTTKTITQTTINYAPNKNTAYQPDAVYTTVYAGQTATERIVTAQQMSPQVTNRHNFFKKDANDDNGLNGTIQTSSGLFSMLKDGESDFVPTSSSFTGSSDVYYTDNSWQYANADPLYKDPIPGGTTVVRPTSGGSKNGHWVVNYVAKDQPIARSDEGWMLKNSSQNYNVLSNDEASFGAVTGISGASTAKLTGIKLLDANGNSVNSYSDDYGTYSVDGNQIKVTAKDKVGYTPIVRYQAVTSDGKTSATGYLQPIIGDTTKTITETGPTSNSDNATTATNTAVTVNQLANDSINEPNLQWWDTQLADSSGNLSRTVTNSQGTWTVDPNNGYKVTFKPANGFSGKASINYTASDSNGNTTTNTINVTVGNFTSVKNSSVNITGGKAVTFNPLLSATKASASLTWKQLQLVDGSGNKVNKITMSQGTFVVNPNNTVTFTPVSGFKGSVPSVQYVATDSNGATYNANINVTVS